MPIIVLLLLISLPCRNLFHRTSHKCWCFPSVQTHFSTQFAYSPGQLHTLYHSRLHANDFQVTCSPCCLPNDSNHPSVISLHSDVRACVHQTEAGRTTEGEILSLRKFQRLSVSTFAYTLNSTYVCLLIIPLVVYVLF